MKDNRGLIVFGFLATFIGLLVLVRFRIVLLGWVVILMLALTCIAYFIKQILDSKAQKNYDTTYSGSIEAKIRHARTQLSKHEREIEDIERNIGELKTKLEISPDLKGAMIQETEKLVRAFQSELKLRHTKIGFYQTSIKKLQSLLQQHQMIQELENKQKSLKKLQEKNYDDLADIENMKSDMEYEKFYLDSIEKLSNRMLESDTLDLAQDLQIELEEVTRKLGDF